VAESAVRGGPCGCATFVSGRSTGAAVHRVPAREPDSTGQSLRRADIGNGLQTARWGGSPYPLEGGLSA
jgi:hypothetical protein